MQPFIEPPKKIPLFLRLAIRIAENTTKKKMLPARILAWLPKAAVGSGVLEALIAHKEKGLSKRFLKLIRMQVSFYASCPFCIDLNSFEFEKYNIIDQEIEALQGKRKLNSVNSFSRNEITTMEYVRQITSTPIRIKEEIVSKMKKLFTNRQFVVICTTIAQVNYWARLVQSLGIPPAGFSANCDILEIEKYRTV